MLLKICQILKYSNQRSCNFASKTRTRTENRSAKKIMELLNTSNYIITTTPSRKVRNVSAITKPLLRENNTQYLYKDFDFIQQINSSTTAPSILTKTFITVSQISAKSNSAQTIQCRIHGTTHRDNHRFLNPYR